MKILSIKGENIASLPEFSIDFTQPPLKEVGIFAITGKTGAGKSTILDALCLALFDKTPRLDKARESIKIGEMSQGDARNLLRRGTGKGMVEVVFLGQDNQKYKATWQARRAHDKPNGSFQNTDHHLYKLGEANPITTRKRETQAKIQEVLGLQFEQFTRAVMLAQGDFTAFLKAGRDEKAALLEKLTGTEIYATISQNIFQKCQEAEVEKKSIEEQAGNYKLLSEEELKSLNSEITSSKEKLKEVEGKQELVKKQRQDQEALVEQYKRVEQAEQQLEEATQEISQAVDRKERLQKLEQAQEARPILEKTKDLQKQDEEQGRRLKAQQQQLSIAQEQLDKASSEKKQAQEQRIATKAEQEAAQPELQKAQELDQTLNFLKQQLADKEKALKQASNNLKSQNQELQKQQATLEKASSEKQQALQWIEEHKAKKPIAENFQTIKVQLADAKIRLDEQKRLLQEQKKLNQSIAQTQQDFEHANEELQNTKIQKEKLDQQVKSQSNLAGQFNLNSLREQIGQHQTVLMQIDKAISHYDGLADQEEIVKELQQREQQEVQKIQKEQETLERLQQEVPGYQEKKQQAATQFREAELASNQSVEDLRSGLEEEKPCPVCGSLHHPYSQEGQTPSQQELHRLKERLEQVSDALKQREDHIHSLQGSLPLLKDYAAKTQQSLNEALSKRSELREAWESTGFSQKVPENERPSAWLTMQKKEVEKQIDTVKSQEQEGRVAEETLNKLKTQLEQAKENENQQDKALREQKFKLERQQQELWQATQQQDQASQTLEKYQTELEPFFTSPNWFDNWKDDPVTFMQKVEAFAQKWNDNQKLALEKDQAEQRLKQSLEIAQRDSNNAQKEEKTKKAAWEEAKNELGQRQNERRQLLNGKTVAEAQKQWKESLEQAESQAEIAQNQQQKAEVALKEAQTTLKAGQEQKLELQASLEKAKSQLESWRSKQDGALKGVSQNELEELLSYSEAFIKEEKAYFESLNEQIIRQTATLKDRQEVLEKLPKVPIDQEALESTVKQLQELQQAKEAAEKHLQEHEYRLKDHKNNLERIASLREKLEKATHNANEWGKLNELLGSSNGSKFQRYVQGYALEILLEYANAQLRFLAPRYRLQGNQDPTTLGLQVIDCDMGDTPRSVYNLSGGETFLVSLALALGLSSFSSNQMNVESLFIDEGFGTLDAETLGVAMEALERLQSQGRKVGVISHVQEMMERIPVQVSVQKMAGGESRVEIIG